MHHAFPSFDHAVEGLALDLQDARGGALVAGNGLEDAHDVAAFELLEGHELRRIVARDDEMRALERSDFIRQIAHGDTPVPDGAEVGILPPVTGG